MDSVLLPIISLVIGTILGLLSSIIVSTYKQRQTVNDKLLDHYFEARKEIVETISILADLNVRNKINEKEIDRFRQKVAILYYKNFDFLPEQVLDALQILHACLLNKKGKLFQIKNKRIVTISEDEFANFIDQVTAYRNTKIFSKIAFKSENEIIKCNLSFKLHAQNVLYNLNKFVTINDLIKISKYLCKA